MQTKEKKLNYNFKFDNFKYINNWLLFLIDINFKLNLLFI